MKKIGIVTHYYHSLNYGGNLQAYALSVWLKQRGYDAKQIGFDYTKGNSNLMHTGKTSKIKKIRELGVSGILKRISNKILLKLMEPKIEQKRKKRAEAFRFFNSELIPNTDKVYTMDTIAESLDAFDVFITGSDQVWNLQWYNSIFFLDFVPSTKTKISYAASIAQKALNEKQKEVFRNSLKGYKAISVREGSAVDLIKDCSPSVPQLVVDPTLLLAKEDWDKVSSNRLIDEKYILCYFLGENKAERKLATRFAKQNNLKIVFIPMLYASAPMTDKGFGDVAMESASPQDFLSLIKHAEYVFTDSFHAVVFSNIYQKQYFVFNRSKKGEMSSRIVDITELFHQKDRFCAGKEKENMQYITSLPDIDYTKDNEDFEKIKQESIAFLEKNLKD